MADSREVPIAKPRKVRSSHPKKLAHGKENCKMVMPGYCTGPSFSLFLMVLIFGTTVAVLVGTIFVPAQENQVFQNSSFGQWIGLNLNNQDLRDDCLWSFPAFPWNQRTSHTIQPLEKLFAYLLIVLLSYFCSECLSYMFLNQQ